MINKASWERVRFGDVIESLNKTTKHFPNESLEALVALDDMDSGELHISRWSKPNLETSFSKIFREGQTLFAKRRAYQKKIAVAHLDGICSGDILVFDSKNPQRLQQNLIPFICMTEDFYRFVEANSQGSLSPRVSLSALNKYEFLLPPINEQDHIAEVLWAVDIASQKYANVLDSTHSLRNSLEAKYFVSYGANRDEMYVPQGWTLGYLSDLVQINPPVTNNLTCEYASFVSMDMIDTYGKITNPQTLAFNNHRKGYTYFEDGDILFAKITPCMENGKGAIARELVNGIALGSTEFYVMRPLNIYDTDYIFALIMSRIYRHGARQWMQGSAGQKRVPRDFFTKSVIRIPPIDERIYIGEVFTALFNSIEKAEQSIISSKRMLHDLINKFFSCGGAN